VVGRKDQPIKNVVLCAVLVSLFIPALIFFTVALSSGLSSPEALTALAEQYVSRKQNLLVIGMLSLLPVVLMVFVIWLIRKIKNRSADVRDLAIGGVAGILAVDIWMNFEYWPTYLPERTYAGFPHGLEFVIGPIFYAPIAMVIGMVAAAMASRRKASR